MCVHPNYGLLLVLAGRSAHGEAWNGYHEENAATPKPVARPQGIETMRDDFSAAVKDLLAKRVAQRCSNPACRKVTSGPQEDPAKAINIGVAAHITAASPDGPRYDPAMSSEARKDAANGIWLCQSCAKLIDNDQPRYSAQIVSRWKTISESAALRGIENATSSDDGGLLFLRLEQLMPDFLDESGRISRWSHWDGNSWC
jgi:hypothetical protein